MKMGLDCAEDSSGTKIVQGSYSILGPCSCLNVFSAVFGMCSDRVRLRQSRAHFDLAIYYPEHEKNGVLKY